MKLLNFDFPISRPIPVPKQYLGVLLADIVGKLKLADYNKYLNWEQLRVIRNMLEQLFSSNKLV